MPINAGLTPILEVINAEGNIRTLESPDSGNYLSRLKSRFENLRQIIKAENRESAANFLEIMINTVNGFALKYNPVFDGLDKIDFPLTIDPNISGLPTTKDVILLEQNRESAKTILEQIGSREDVIGKLRKAILRDDTPAIRDGQFVLAKYNFFNALSEIEVLTPYSVKKINKTINRDKTGRDSFEMEWSCIERGSGFPIYYRMLLTRDNGLPEFSIGSNPRLEMMLYQTQLGISDLSSFAFLIDNEVEEIHPKLLERYKIGPFMNRHTANGKRFTPILTEAPDSSILGFTIERVVSTRVSNYGNFWDAIRGKKTEREQFSPVDSEKKLVTSYRVKQRISGKDEDG